VRQTQLANIYIYTHIEFLAIDAEVPGSISGATRFSE
jgi:hypothetical protein